MAERAGEYRLKVRTIMVCRRMPMEILAHGKGSGALSRDKIVCRRAIAGIRGMTNHFYRHNKNRYKSTSMPISRVTEHSISIACRYKRIQYSKRRQELSLAGCTRQISFLAPARTASAG